MPVLEVRRQVVVHEIVVALVEREEGVVEVSGGAVTLGLLPRPDCKTDLVKHLKLSVISPLNGAPAFACNFPLGHPVLEVPSVVVGDLGDEGGDREEHEDGRDGHDDVEVVQDALFVVRRESLFQGRPFLLRQNTLPVKFMFHDAFDVAGF